MTLSTLGRERPFCYTAPMDATPRTRLLEAAADLFYSHGIQSVGVDRIVAHAHVTLATFYRQFPSKDELVVAYLEAEHEGVVALCLQGFQGLTNLDELPQRFLELLGLWVEQKGLVGCPFLHAASEYRDPIHPVRLAVYRHRLWFRSTLETVLSSLGHPTPGLAADRLVLLRDAAMVGGALDDPQAVKSAVISLVGPSVHQE